MNVNAAKAPFTWKTRNTLMAHLANKLNCGIDIERIRGDPCQWDGKIKMYQISQVQLMKKIVEEKHNNDTKLCMEIAYLELIVHVGLLFNDSLMNCKDRVCGVTRIDIDNIKFMEKSFQTLMD